MLKYLRIAVTALSLTACVLLVALWVRSYWRSELIFRVSPASQVTTIGSNRGRVYFIKGPFPAAGQNVWQYAGKTETDPAGEPFQWEINGVKTKIKLPYWLLVPIAGTTAALPSIRRFTLRTLLVVTTLVAIALGVIARLGL